MKKTTGFDLINKQKMYSLHLEKEIPYPENPIKNIKKNTDYNCSMTLALQKKQTNLFSV